MTEEKEWTPPEEEPLIGVKRFDLPDWFSRHIPNWEKWLAPHVGKALCALEIGSCEGRSALWLLDNVLSKHPDSMLDCVDPFTLDGNEASDMPDILYVKRTFENFKKNLRIDVSTRVITHYQNASIDVLPGLVADGMIYDIIYIDGSHMAVDVLQDIVFCWRLLRPGGTLILDDYEWGAHSGKLLDTPRLAIDAFLSIYLGRYELLGLGVQVCVRKKV